jgi:hypothetical protein
MQLTVDRSSKDRMTDMYVLRFPVSVERFVSFRIADWEAFCPEIRLQRGEHVTHDFVLSLSQPTVFEGSDAQANNTENV